MDVRDVVEEIECNIHVEGGEVSDDREQAALDSLFKFFGARLISAHRRHGGQNRRCQLEDSSDERM